MTAQTIIIGALASAAFGAATWIAVNWMGKPILDLRSARLEAIKAADGYGFIGFGFKADEVNKARSALSDAANSLRALSRGQPWTARLYCRCLSYHLELAASVLLGLVGLLEARLPYENTSRRDGVDAVHVLLNASRHLSADRINEVWEKINTPLALPRG